MKSDEMNQWHSLPIPLQKEHKRCAYCRKILAVEVKRENDDVRFENRNFVNLNFKRGKVIRWRYKSYGYFHT